MDLRGQVPGSGVTADPSVVWRLMLGLESEDAGEHRGQKLSGELFGGGEPQCSRLDADRPQPGTERADGQGLAQEDEMALEKAGRVGAERSGMGPLAGLRVIEVSSFVAAPLGGMTLRQLGADVIRVDPLGGFAHRHRWPVTSSGASLYWAGLNRGKRSLVVDMRTRGRAADRSRPRGVVSDRHCRRPYQCRGERVAELRGPVCGMPGSDSRRSPGQL